MAKKVDYGQVVVRFRKPILRKIEAEATHDGLTNASWLRVLAIRYFAKKEEEKSAN